MTPMMEVSGGSPIPYTITSLRAQGNNWRRIEMLSDDILLDIFDFYRLDAMTRSGGRPWRWHRLAHVCQKWRHIISTSPRRLDLRILCDNRTPIEILDVWPTLPLAVSFRATQESTLMPRNITAALRHLDRIWQVELHVTSSMIRSLAEIIQKPCRALESISITVEDATGASIPVRNAFLGGSAPQLKEIKLNGIFYPFPKLRQVFLSTNNLVELRLSKIPNAVYFPPDDLVTGLSTLVQLKSLSIDFDFTASHPPARLTHPHQRATLSSLASLDFHGASEYLEVFMARINSPALSKITIRLFNQIFFEIPQFCQFILRPNALGSPTWVIVTHSAESVSVLLTLNRNEHYLLGTSCKRLDWQLSFVTEVLTQLSDASPLLSGVRSLTIQKGDELPSMKDMDSTQWLELFRPFTHVTLVRVSEEQLVPSIVQALVTEDMATAVLPELFSLHLEKHSAPSVVEAAEQFVAARKLSGHTVFLSG